MIEDITSKMIAAINGSPLIGAQCSLALDSYNVLEKINDADGADIVIVDVGAENPLGDWPEAGVAETLSDVYVARSFGLSEPDCSIFFARIAGGSPLFKLRDAVRDELRALKLDNSDGMLESPYLAYKGCSRFETPYNLRAATFKLTFSITGSLPAIQYQG